VLSLPYHADPLPLLAALRPLGRAVLLHSADPTHAFARYDIVSAAPRLALETRGTVTRLLDGGGCRESRRDPFELMDEVLAGTPAPADRDAPFAGGFVGLAGYDLARREAAVARRLQGTAANPSPFPDLAAGLYGWAIVTDHLARTTTLQVLPGESCPDDLAARLARARAPEPLAPPHLAPEVDRDGYGAAFRRVQAWIRAGDCYQVNLAVPFSAPCEDDALALYAGLIAHQPAPYAGFLETPDGAVLSCSPERLLRCEQGVLETSPIKGTRPRHADGARDAAAAAELLASPKERAENLMIVDLLRNDLGRSCRPGTIAVPRLFEVQSFPAVHHLVSTIRGELQDGVTPLAALARAFPGGSVTGAPKLRAMEIIDVLEPRRRGPYCGSLFRVDAAGRLDASITIRTLLLAGGRLSCWGGGGLVADSEEEAEWREIHAKIGSLVGHPEVAVSVPAQASAAKACS